MADADPLRLGDDDRFEVTVAWKGPRGATGAGVPKRLTDDTGYFWFFDRDNVELVVKVLDAAAVDQRYWVFYGALSNVEYEMTVVDTAVEGPSYPHVAEYLNPAGTMASRGDTEALPRPPDFPPWSAAAGRATAHCSSAALASEGSETLGLRDGRFEATVEWEDFRGNAGTGTARAITSDTGYFWFFSPDNVELGQGARWPAGQRPLVGVRRRALQRRLPPHRHRHGERRDGGLRQPVRNLRQLRRHRRLPAALSAAPPRGIP